MKQPASGQVHERITAIADTSYPADIVRGEEKRLMIDSGVNLLAPRYLAALQELLGEAGELDSLFLPHSHYDHVGSADYLKRHLPGLKIGAHERAAALVQKPSALETMNALSTSHVDLLEHNTDAEDLTMQPFEIDIHLKQGDEIDLGGLTCRVYETPGHTRDSLAYYIPEIGALFPGDACGVLLTDPESTLQVAFVASYQAYVDSLELLIALEPKLVCLAHNWMLPQEDATEFLQRSLAETFRYRELIDAYLDAANGDPEDAINEMVRAEYGAKAPTSQPRAAHMANLTAQFRHIAAVRAE